MIEKLQKRIDKLNQSLEKTLIYMEELSVDKLHQSSPNTWSAAQILFHLKESETGTLTYLNKKVQAPKSEVESGGVKSLIRSFFLSRALRNYDKKFKAPPILKEMPERPNFTEIKADYLEIRKNMGLLLEKFDKEMLSKAYFKHPRAGRITIIQTLQFLQDHFDRHAEQILERSR